MRSAILYRSRPQQPPHPSGYSSSSSVVAPISGEQDVFGHFGIVTPVVAAAAEGARVRGRDGREWRSCQDIEGVDAVEWWSHE